MSATGNGRRDVLVVEDLVKHFPNRGSISNKDAGAVKAVDGISLTIGEGECLGLVGESGCGKTTAGRAIAKLIEPTSGRIEFNGIDITHLDRREMRPHRQDLQFVFQDPYASLNPRKNVGFVISEPMRVHGTFKDGGADRVASLLERVGLKPSDATRYPHEFSGGQRQRISIARALALEPKVLILDEPVSALDVSIQAQVINLLRKLQEDLGLAYLFIAHDLSVVRHVSDRIAVMYLGRIVETGTKREVFENPTHPYTQALLSAVPDPEAYRRTRSTRIVLEGDLPSPSDPPSGCTFHTRCWKAQPDCSERVPSLADGSHLGHPSSCYHAAPLGSIEVQQPSGQQE